jgi:hypothetical protein
VIPEATAVKRIRGKYAVLVGSLNERAAAPVLHCGAADTLWSQRLGQLLFSRQLANGQVAFVSFLVTVHGDCPDFRGVVREHGTVPLGAQSDRHAFPAVSARKDEPVPRPVIGYARSESFEDFYWEARLLAVRTGCQIPNKRA